MSDSRNNSKVLNLSDARERTPPVDPVEAMRKQLATALFGGVKEADVIEMAEKLKAMAMSGNLKAMDMYFKLILPKEQKTAPAPPPADSAGLKMLAEAMSDLVDEIRIGKARSERAALTNGHTDDE